VAKIFIAEVYISKAVRLKIGIKRLRNYRGVSAGAIFETYLVKSGADRLGARVG